MTPPTTTLRKSTSTVMSSSGSLSDSATAAASSSPSSSLDFFHSNNSKMLSKALSTLSAAQPRSTTLLPSVSSSSSSSSSSIKLLNEAFEVSSRNTNYLDSIKKSFFSSANDKKKGELQKLMEDVLIEQRKEQLMEEMEEENTRFKRPQSPRRETESANIITELLTSKTSTTPTIRVINTSSSDSSNTNLIEQTKNETLRALISGPYSTKKIPLPPPPPQLPLATLKATSGQLVAAGSCCSPAERRLNELKHEIIDLVSTNTASSFPVEENTSSPAANKKLVQELDEKEASMTKAMNKNMSFLESTLTRARGKKDIIENFLKLKSLLNTGSSSPTSEADSVDGGVRKLSMRSAAAGTTSGHKFVLDREQIRRIGAAKMDNSVKRLNLYSSIASKYFPKTSNKWDEENGTDQQEQEKHRHNHVEIVELDGEEEYIDENDDEEEEDEEDEDDIEMEDEQYMDDEEDEEDDDENDEEENNMIENENEEEEENELENILIRKRLTEPGIYVRGKGRGKYECPKCMWRARKLCVLKRHIMVSHANFKPFLCTYCKVAFKTKGNLVRHTKTKAHIRACSKLGMSPGDDEVTRISSKNIDSHQLNKQLKIDKRIKVS